MFIYVCQKMFEHAHEVCQASDLKAVLGLMGFMMVCLVVYGMARLLFWMMGE